MNFFFFIKNKFKIEGKNDYIQGLKVVLSHKYDSNFSGFFDEISSDWFTISFLVPSPCLWFRWDVTLSQYLTNIITTLLNSSA